MHWTPHSKYARQTVFLKNASLINKELERTLRMPKIQSFTKVNTLLIRTNLYASIRLNIPFIVNEIMLRVENAWVKEYGWVLFNFSRHQWQMEGLRSDFVPLSPALWSLFFERFFDKFYRKSTIELNLLQILLLTKKTEFQAHTHIAYTDSQRQDQK